MAKSRGAGNFYIGAADNTYGTIVNCTEDDAVELKQSYDANGEPDGVDYTNRVITMTMEIQVDGTMPAAGATISCKFEDGTTANAIIASVGKTEDNNEYKTGTITAERYPTNSVPS